MNFVHRQFFNQAARRAQLYTPVAGSGLFSKITNAVRVPQTPGNVRPGIRGRFYGLGASSVDNNEPHPYNYGFETVYDRAGNRNFAFGQVPDYGTMLMQPTTSPGYTPPSWLTTATEFIKQAVPVYQQTQLLREQQKRREAGLPPLQAAELAPTVRVQAGLDPNITRMIMLGGLGLGAILLAKTFMR